MPQLGPMEIMVILVVALLVLGPTKLPEAAKQAGRALAEFRQWSGGIKAEMKDAVRDVDPRFAAPDYGRQVPRQAGDVVDARPSAPAVADGDGPKPPSQFPDGQSFS
jgi:sec-independent protein translocase protein TatA